MKKLDLGIFDKTKNEAAESIVDISLKDIAIIGMHYTFPGCSTPEEFWDMLANGKSVLNLPEGQRQKDIDDYLARCTPQFRGKAIRPGAYLQEIDTFDSDFFRISRTEASLMNPEQRIFIETVFHALEHAGYGGDAITSSRTGIFIGYNGDSILDYKRLVMETDPSFLPMALTGNLGSVIAGRIAHLLDLHGPVMMIDTACSSSLVAVHQACLNILNDECTLAIAGSVKINLIPLKWEHELGIESSDGKTRSFDGNSDGTGIGEGAAAIILKSLHRAQTDGDRIYAVIKGSSVNHDGKSIGLTAPNMKAQYDLLIEAWQKASVDPVSITFIEAHGTGTQLGDSIEIKALQDAFKNYTSKKHFCALGSVKSNLGHLDHAAGITGLVKAVLALQKKTIPATLHVERPNSAYDADNSPLYINIRTKEWENSGFPRRCGVSSFGLSGTNCHLVLEEYNHPPYAEAHTVNVPHIFCISAKEAFQLNTLLEAYVDFLRTEGDTSFEDICYTASIGRGHYRCRLAVIAENREHLLERLRELSRYDFSAPGIPADSVPILTDDFYFGIHDTSIKQDEKDIDKETIDTCVKNAADAIASLKGQNSLRDPDELLARCRELSLLYVRGASIDWKRLYGGTRHNRVALPVYPFKRTRCWVSADDPDRQAKTDTGTDSSPEKNLKLKGRENGVYSDHEKQLATVLVKVLGTKSLDFTDHFLDLGGDSLIAIQLINRIRKEYDIHMNVSDILDSKTLFELAGLFGKKNRVRADETMHIPAAPTAEYYPATPAQQRIFILEQMNGPGTVYNLPMVKLIKGPLKPEILHDAFQKIIARQESYRTFFDIVDGEIVAKIASWVNFQVQYLTNPPDNDPQRMIEEFIQPFDLSQAPLIRAAIIFLKEDEYLLLLDQHHIISDGLSALILVNELISFYKGIDLPPLSATYKDFSVWYKEYLETETLKEDETYWLNRFSGTLPLLNMFHDFPADEKRSFKGAQYFFTIDNDLYDGIKGLCSSAQATLHNLLMCVYHILLRFYSGQEDIIVGFPASNRPDPELEKVIGMFVNTLALRSHPSEEKTFAGFLKEIKKDCMDALEHKHYQFEKLVEKLSLPGSTGRNPLFDTVFMVQDVDRDEIRTDDILIRSYHFQLPAVKFDIIFQAKDSGNNISFIIEYAADLFKEDTIKQLAADYRDIVAQVVKEPDARIKDISLKRDYRIISHKDIGNLGFDL